MAAQGTPIMVVTGASRGIGRSLVAYFLDRGYYVHGCSRSATDLVHAAYEHHCLDVADEKAVRTLMTHIRKSSGVIDVLINNAGVASMNHSVLVPLRQAENVLRTNVLGTFLFSREAVKLMKKSKSPRIVNFSSCAVPMRLEGEAIYAASKAAVVSLTQVLAREYASLGVRVNAVSPPVVKTDLTRSIPEEKLQALMRRTSIPRYGTTEEVCRTVEFLTGAGADMITGQVIYMGGV